MMGRGEGSIAVWTQRHQKMTKEKVARPVQSVVSVALLAARDLVEAMEIMTVMQKA